MGYENDEESQEIIRKAILELTDNNAEYQYVQGIIRKQDGKIFVGSAGNIRQKIIYALHYSALGGHSGQTACLQRIKLSFIWPKMKNDVIEVVKGCEICQRSKGEHVQYLGLLQPLAIPTQPWKDISIDFVEQLPLSKGMDTVLVIADRLSKYGHFIALKHSFTTSEVP